VLQGLVSLTFGLAFVGTWRAFQRRAAFMSALAWLLYAAGLWLSLGSMAFGLARQWPPAARGLVGIPLLLGALLFRPATDAVIERDLRASLRSYVAVFATVVVVLTLGRAATARWLPEVAPILFPYFVPRAIVALAFAWAAVPFLTRGGARGVGHVFMGLLLLALSARIGASAVLELHPPGVGRVHQPDSLLLSLLQVGILILLGVATSIVLTEAEAARALSDARTIRETAEALHASEERFRFVAEHSSDLQLLVGADRRIRYASASCERLLGVPATALEGRLLAEVLHEDDRAAAASAFADRAAGPSGSWPVLTLRVRHQSGGPRLFEIRGRTVPDAGAEYGGPAMVFSLRDVTETRRLEEEVRQAQKMDAIGRLAGGVAHDFNNMMMAITGQCELVALKRPAGNELVRALHEVQQVAQSAATLAQQLLAFGRRQALQPRVVGLNRICERCFRMLRRLIGENVEIRFLPASDLHPVRADPSGLEQILMNLSVNARDAMPHGGIMTVSTANAALEAPLRVGEESLPAGEYVLLRVTDTGVGMDEATRRQIFEPFFTTKEPGKGTGLGLAVVYGVVRQSGGAIAVDSTFGGGSTFTVYLPATDGPYDADVSPASLPEPARGSENILLVEDDDAVRNATASYLSAAGYGVRTASSGAAALEIAGDGGPEIDLLLTDVILPGLNGRQVAETLTARHPRLRVLYLSGHPRDALALDAPLPPRTAFIQKPIPLRDLLREVRALLDVQ